MLAVCARATRREDVRLIAIIDDSARAGVVARVATSGLIRARQPWYDPGPTLSGVLTAVFGFLTGLGTSFIQKWWERRKATDDALMADRLATTAHVRDMEATVIKAIGPEWEENRKKLERFVGSTTAPPEQLIMAGHGAILGDTTGALAYLKEPPRQLYLRRLNQVYEKIADYNDEFLNWRTVHDADSERSLREAAAQVLEAYKGPPPIP